MSSSSWSRRRFCQLGLQAGSLALVQSYLPGGLAFGAPIKDKRLMVVVLRGALDGLAAVAPVGDKSYADVRGALALPHNADVLLDLDGFFAMHSALKPLMPLYQQKQMLVMHAVATSYRERSHFDAQNLLENGSDKPYKLSTGWLNRAVQGYVNESNLIAMGSNIPLLLRGAVQAGSWSSSVLPGVEDDFLLRVGRMYESDPDLMGALNKAVELQGMSEQMNADRGGGRNFIQLMSKAAEFMKPDNGMLIGTAELGGWDTHANQGLGQGALARNMATLAEGLHTFKEKMGDAWDKTAVLCVTEFGRTVRANGSGGTDHGTGSVAFLLGGKVNGGRVIGDWPGLAKLYQDRDLIPANDLRGLIKATLNQHLNLPSYSLDREVFPGSEKIQLKDKLFI